MNLEIMNSNDKFYYYLEIMKSSDKFYLDKYAKYREWIQERLENGFDWEKIKYGLRDDEAGLSEFLSQQRKNMLWDIDIIEWLELVEFEIKNEILLNMLKQSIKNRRKAYEV